MPENNQQRPVQELDYKPVQKMETTPPPEAPEEAAVTTRDVRNAGSLPEKAKLLIQLVQQRPMIAHILRATERFNDRLGNQFGARILPLSTV
jgi:membrane protein